MLQRKKQDNERQRGVIIRNARERGIKEDPKERRGAGKGVIVKTARMCYKGSEKEMGGRGRVTMRNGKGII